MYLRVLRKGLVQKVDDIRAISNEFCADGNAKSSSGLSNMVWGFGQFLGTHLATPPGQLHARESLAVPSCARDQALNPELLGGRRCLIAGQLYF